MRSLLLAALAAACCASVAAAQTAATATRTLAVGATVRGSLAAGDPVLSDSTHFQSWRFRAAAGEPVEIELRSTAFDAYLLLSRVDGDSLVAVASDDDGGGGTDARIATVLEEAGEYEVRANTVLGGQTGDYSLRIGRATVGGAVVGAAGPGGGGAPPAPAAASGTIAVGETARGELAAGDAVATDSTLFDEFRLVARGGDRLRLELRSGEFDAYLLLGRLVDGAFVPLEGDDDGAGGTDSRLTYDFAAGGEYRVRANSLRAGEGGAYTLRVLAAEPAAPPPSARPIRAGETVAGDLAEGDPRADDETWYDEFALRAEAGERVLIDLVSEEFDTYLVVGRWEEGAFRPLATNDDVQQGDSSSAVVFRFATAGDYAVRANSLGRSTGAYRLSVRRLEP